MRRKRILPIAAAALAGLLLAGGTWRVWHRHPPLDLGDLAQYAEPYRDSLPAPDPAGAAPDPARLMVYKARPLNGVWATAPFLHNGSVPTLYDLLLPPDRRPKEFTVGRPVPGNGNAGHEYGTRLTDAERWQLVEYLKSL